jgi:hypothetical protein
MNIRRGGFETRPRNHLYRTGCLIDRGGLFFGAALIAEGDHLRDLAYQFDLEAVFTRMHDHFVDEAPQNVERLIMGLWIGESAMEVRDLAAIDLRQVGMQARRRRWGFQQRRF